MWSSQEIRPILRFFQITGFRSAFRIKSKDVYSDQNQEQRDAKHYKAFHGFCSYLKVSAAF
jgi:hypothetical protein